MLAALCLAMVFAISLSSYVALCYVSLNMSTRSVMLLRSAELAEAGVEQALYSVNNSDWSNWTISGNVATATMTMTATGLVPSSSSPTPLNYGNAMTGQVNLTVTNYNTPVPAPSITSQAVFTTPVNGGGTQTTTSETITYQAPAVGTDEEPLFVNAVAATTGNILFQAAGFVDSYNSNPAPLTYQTYAPALAGYSAVLASQHTTTVSASVRLGNAVLHGYATGYNNFSPGTTNWLSYGGSAQIAGPNTPPTSSIDSSRLLSNPSPYQPLFLENRPPNPSTTLPAACTSDSVTINQSATLGSTTSNTPAVYQANGGINLTSGSQTLIIQGPVVIVSYGNVWVTNGSADTPNQPAVVAPDIPRIRQPYSDGKWYTKYEWRPASEEARDHEH